MIPTPAPAFDPAAWWAAVDGARTAVIDTGAERAVSYAELHADAERWRACLRRHGVRPGDRIAVLAHNRYEFLPLFVACLRVGAVLVPLNWRLTTIELGRVLQHAEPVLLFAESRFVHHRSAATMTRWLDLDLDLDRDLDAEAVAPPSAPPVAPMSGAQDRREHGLAMLLYTSGTTGAPKGVMVSHRQLVWNAVSTILGWSLCRDDVAAIATPLFHTAAWHVFATPLLYCGGCVVVLPDFDPSTWFAQLERHGVTRVFCVPTQLHRLRQAPDFGRPLPALRTFISGGAPLPPHLAATMRGAGYTVRDAYGLTECGPNCFVITDSVLAEKPWSVGTPLPFLRMRVMDAHGIAVPPGGIGELQLEGPQLFDGYFRDAPSTLAAMTSDGWLRSGDLVTVDDEGHYRLRGRVKDLFISGGENVYPGEVEATLAACDGVQSVAVVGVPDETWGEVGCAFVVPARDGVRTEDLLREARRGLAGYKVPRLVVWVEALPLLGNGKVDRAALRSLASQTTHGEDWGMSASTRPQPLP